MDRRLLGADRDGDEVAVPGGELLELREQLLALGAARRALHPLLGVARRQLESGDARLLDRRAPPPAARLRVREQRRRGLRGLERRIAVDALAPARSARRAARATAGSSRRSSAVEPAAGDARERRRARPRRARARARRPARGSRAPTAGGTARAGSASGSSPGSGPSSSAIRTITAYGGGSSRSLSSASAASSFEQVRAVDEVDPPVGLERPHVQVAPQLADRVDADHLAERVELVQVGVELARRAEQRARERARDLALPDAGRPVEEIARAPGPRAAPRRAAAPPRRAQRSARTCSRTSSAISVSAAGRRRARRCGRARRRPARDMPSATRRMNSSPLALDPVVVACRRGGAPRRDRAATRKVRSGSSAAA